MIYNILSVAPQDDSGETVAEVSVQITGQDGSSLVRTTFFVYEDGEWKHRFSQEEYETSSCPGCLSTSSSRRSEGDGYE